MARLCPCRGRGRSRCRHYVRGDEPALQPEKVLRLEPVIGILIDFAQDFDAAGLEIDLACGLHGARPQPNVECLCDGRRYSAAEFIETLGIELRAAKMRNPKALSQDRRAKWARKERAKLRMAG